MKNIKMKNKAPPNKTPNEVNPYDLSSSLKERQWFKSKKNKDEKDLWDALGDVFNHEDYK